MVNNQRKFKLMERYTLFMNWNTQDIKDVNFPPNDS